MNLLNVSMKLEINMKLKTFKCNELLNVYIRATGIIQLAENGKHVYSVQIQFKQGKSV